jgi:GntR family transcriptional regulator/MocR family aminotransferase
LEIHSPEAGIHCVGWLPNGMDALMVARKATDYDLQLTPVSSFSIEPLTRQGLLLGYGGYSVQDIKAGVRRLGTLLRSA